MEEKYFQNLFKQKSIEHFIINKVQALPLPNTFLFYKFRLEVLMIRVLSCCVVSVLNMSEQHETWSLNSGIV